MSVKNRHLGGLPHTQRVPIYRTGTMGTFCRRMGHDLLQQRLREGGEGLYRVSTLEERRGWWQGRQRGGV